LARALYGRYDTYVLDDVFSALDAETEAQVFTNLFGPNGLLSGKSVVLATNQVYRLSYASWITVLQEGEVVEQGQFLDLMADEGVTAQLVREFAAGALAKKERQEEAYQSGSGQAQSLEADSESDPSGSLAASEHGMEAKKRGATSWNTYLLYLRGMGLFSATLCE
jgi:ATP-binding cassette subfamily C (CFTR/MRP) protein 1